ncbi:MAG: hypothetical protein ACO3N7_07235 [Kiritimatiellia bacterium]
MRRRQMLLGYDRDPDATWKFLRSDAGLSFNHRPRSEQRSPNYPSAIDPAQYSLNAFLQQAERQDGLLNDVTDRGLEIALAETKDPEHRRAFLGQLRRPDLPGLVDLILADLDYKESRGFGQHPVHSLLTRAQLEELGRRKPDLLRSQAYVTERLARIQPPEVDLSHDHPAAIAYYQELWAFVQTLGDMHNSLKASTLYRLLDHQRKTGVYDPALFQTYLAFPRQMYYVERSQREAWQRQRADWVNFNYAPGRNIILPPIGGEEPLVRDFLLTLLKTEPHPSAYERFFESEWLNALFAESKILHGAGRAEDWAHLLSPAQYREILDRVELDFAPENPATLKPGEAVILQVDLKRVDKLLLKIYELQTFNYYKTYQAAVDQAVDLDGMIPTHERSLELKSDPGRRVRRQLDLPEIRERGVYVVELIGNGVSSRALLHVGHLEAVTQATAAGQAMLVLNEQRETVMDARVWMNGREYRAGKQGLILLPYSENPGPRFVILQDGNFASPENILHLGEEYTFDAGILIDAQSLNQRSTAQLILRPDLRVQGIPLDPALLGEVRVTLASTDAQGTRSEREFKAVFSKNEEWLREFYVPEGLRNLEVSVQATLQRKTDLEKIQLSDQYTLAVNQARSGDTLRQVFLVPHDRGFALELRGLKGESLADLPMRVQLHHPAFRQTISQWVTSDDQGRVDLGPLNGLSRIQVSGEQLSLDRPLEGGRALLPARLHLRSGERVSLPYPYARTPDLQAASLLRKGRGGVNLEDLGDKIHIEDGELFIEDLPPGSFELTLHETGRTLTLEVAEGENHRGYLFEGIRRLQMNDPQLPSIARITKTPEGLRLKLRNLKQGSRVALRAYRYAMEDGIWPEGPGYPLPLSREVYPPHTQYISGRKLGDEYRYVLERRFREIFAGTLLERPGLILNPWMLRETEAELETLKQDQAYRGGRQRLNLPAELRDAVRMEGLRVGRTGRAKSSLSAQNSIGVDFLPSGSRWLGNLQPAADGTLEIPLENPGEYTVLDVVVLDRFGHSVTRVPLSDRNFKPAEVRLMHGLNPEKNFSKQKTVRRMDPGQPVLFPDLATSRYQVIGDFGTAFDLLQTLSGDARLAKFEFLKTWPSLEMDAKLEKYGEFASHELHLFLYARDPEFFAEVVKPYLRNKKDKTFVDRWLLDALTDDDLRLDKLQQRNALELALLARRGGDAGLLQEALREAWELLPPDPEAFANRVRVALQANELDDVKSLERDALKKEAGAFRYADADLAPAPAAADPFGGVSSPISRRAMPSSSVTGVALGLEQADFAKDSSSVVDAEEERALFEMDEIFAGEAVDRLYRALPKTKEWAEQNYYEVRTEQDLPRLIPVNRFWRDLAAGVTVSPHLLEAGGSLNEVLCALAFCGLPFESEAPEESLTGASLQLSVSRPSILVSEQILPAVDSEDARPLLISQQFFRPDDLYRFEGNEQIEKFVTGEFIRRRVYGARITLTNPTASRRRLNVLLQIPEGAIPLRNGFTTDDRSVLLQPYTTQTVEYFFTFPESGSFSQFPAHAADRESIIGKAAPRVFEVKDTPTEVDKNSWEWVSQYAGAEETLAFLGKQNLRRIDLAEMAWRLKDRDFFLQVIELLQSRACFDETCFSYAVYHEIPELTRIWLANSLLSGQVGPVFESPLLTVNPVERKTYQHLEYDPLVNPRAHDVGAKREILNLALRDQYRSFLTHALYRESLDAPEQLALVYYLLLQDRLEEAVAQLDKVETQALNEQMQLAYLQAWVALRKLEVDQALALALPYADVPVPRWQSRFRSLIAAVEESRGADTESVETPTREQDLQELARREPSVELEIVSGKLMVTAHHLESLTLNLYPMDIELLFSRKPFLSDGGADFAVIKPELRLEIPVQGNGEAEELLLPEAYRDRNLMVEVRGKGRQASVAWVANQLKVRKMENYGQVEVRTLRGNQPLPKTYVKVFAKSSDGRVSFWKDGYTDLRGRFDYLSLNNRKPEEAAELSILILHPEFGAEIIRAAPPTR